MLIKKVDLNSLDQCKSPGSSDLTGLGAFIYLSYRDKEKNRKIQLKQTGVRVQTIPICTDLADPKLCNCALHTHNCAQIRSIKSCTEGWQIKRRGGECCR